MSRPLRVNRDGGWYHITCRGQNRQRIYLDTRDRKHFLELLKECTRRFGVEIHAYVLMSNHYHLLLRTPRGNVSAAMQWLNQSYGLWWNRRHHRCGHIFQGRFKSVLVEEGGWVLALSFYLHFNPVAVKDLGWGKSAKKAERLGLVAPSAEVVARRLETLRGHRWSSYPGYAGYEKLPDWLSSGEILSRVPGGRDGYRRKAEEQLRQGVEENIWSQLKWGAVLGSERFAESVRQRIKIYRETPVKKRLRQQVPWEALVEAVEKVKGERWAEFHDRYGDRGREMAFWIAQRRGGMSLKDIAQKAGGLDYAAVSEAIRYFERKHLMKAEVQRVMKAIMSDLNDRSSTMKRLAKEG